MANANCQQLWKITKTVCHDCIHYYLFTCWIYVHNCYICYAMLNQLLYCWCINLTQLMCWSYYSYVQERHPAILQSVSRGDETIELKFHVLKSTSQVKEQCFAVIATYIPSAETILVTESCNSCYLLNKMHPTFKSEDYIWCISLPRSFPLPDHAHC